MGRPYFSKGIVELESLYENNTDNPEILRSLLRELEHRKTQRAGNLRDLVEPRLAGLEMEQRESDSGSGSAAEVRPGDVSGPEPVDESTETEQWGAVDIEPRTRVEEFAQAADLGDAFWEQPIDPSDLTQSEPAETVEITNSPSAILDAWLALEVLSPQSFSRPADLASGDYRCVARFKKGLPWSGDGEKARPNTRLFYHVVLGAVRLNLATADLLRAFGDTRPERPRTKDYAALAILTVDKLGRPAGESPIAVSSFGYGYQKARQGEFSALKQWTAVEEKIIERLRSFLVRYTEDEQEILPVDLDQIGRASCWLTSGFGIPDSHFVRPEFAIRTYQWFMAPNPPEPLLLNSFFLSDLKAAGNLIVADGAGKALRRYLAIETPTDQVDLLDDKAALERLLAPEHMPFSRWPAAGRHSLVLLQQAAVNLGLRELDEEGLVGVNGPPGTGKTTLLRDVVAAIVARRAEQMCRIDDPEKAFAHAGQIRSGSSFNHLYSIHESLQGHEIVVASANNKAVENISREIPEAVHVEPGRSPDYYASIADNVAGEDGSCWGIAAAVLGNAANRVKFYKDFWKDEDRGMRQYLWACQGNDTTITRIDEDSGEEIQVRPTVVEREAPPVDRADALDWWKKERRRYRKIASKAKTAVAELEKIRRNVLRSAELRRTCNEYSDLLDKATFEASTALSAFQHSVHRLSEVKASFDRSQIDVKQHKSIRPSLFSRLFRREAWRDWKGKHIILRATLASLQSELKETKSQCDRAKQKADIAKTGRLDAQAALDEVNKQKVDVEELLRPAKSSLGPHFADQDYWARNHEDLQTSVAWLDSQIQELRDECFAAAFELHKAFVAAAAKPVRNNLQALFSILLGSGLDESRRHHLPSLWSTFFLVVPVVSSTFASIGRMMGPMPNESLGWLLIDEAGQASPQMAVGSIMRAKRAYVVGDPLQIEPVVTLSNQLVSRVAGKFGVDSDKWMAPKVSVQALADAASDYAAWIDRQEGAIRVGAPLLVHRRCEEPMFGISNAISYANLMVQATQPQRSPIRDTLGESRWIDVAGTSRYKWSPEEGDKVIELLMRLVQAELSSPDIFIITPFRSIAQGLRDKLRKESGLFDSLSDDPGKWLWDRVGTVHTFQGKQAEAVILVLGAQGAGETFARQWASRPPNLINVAVSRAKNALYVVGNRQLWGDIGSVSQLSARLRQVYE